VAFVAEAARTPAAAVPLNRALERLPGNVLQHGVENAIVVRHGVGLLMSGDVAKRRKMSRINAV